MARRIIKLKQCIYCFGKDGEDSNISFNTEHVVPRCISRGGCNSNNLTLHGAVCASCNNWFGRTLDPMMAEVALRGTVSIIYGIDELPLALTKKLKLNYIFPLKSPLIQPLHGARIRMEHAGGQFRMGFIPQIAFERHDGSWYHMTRRKLCCIPRIYDDTMYTGKAILIKEDNVTKEAIEYLEEKGITLQSLSCLQDAEVHLLVLSSLVNCLQRAVARIAFNYFAWLLLPTTPEILLSPAFDQIRRYVRYGEQQSPEIVQVQNDFSEARLPMFPEHYSAVLKIKSDDHGICGEVSLFDLITWRVSIAGDNIGNYMPDLPAEHILRLRQRLTIPGVRSCIYVSHSVS